MLQERTFSKCQVFVAQRLSLWEDFGPLERVTFLVLGGSPLSSEELGVGHELL